MACACRKSGVLQACSKDISPSSHPCPDSSGTRLSQGSSLSPWGLIPKGWLCEAFPGLTQLEHQVVPHHTGSKVFPPALPSVRKKICICKGICTTERIPVGFFREEKKKSFSIALSGLLKKSYELSILCCGRTFALPLWQGNIPGTREWMH